MAEYIRKFFLELRQKSIRAKESERPYDFRAFIPLTDVLKYCNKDYRITEKRIRELCKLGLLAVYEDKQRGEIFSLSSPGRIEFIEDLKKNYQYSDEILKEIIRHEQSFIMNILSNREFFSHKYDSLIDASRELQAFIEKNSRNKEAKIIKRTLLNFDKGWLQLGDEDKKGINQSIFVTRYSQELEIYFRLMEFRKPILLGYSPSIIFERVNKFEDAVIDWDSTLEKIKESETRFVSVKSFQIAVIENQVMVHIKNPQSIKTGTEFERIRSVYSIYRNILKVKNWQWGENSGNYKYQLIFYRFVIKRYRHYCKEYPDYTKIRIIREFLLSECARMRHVEEEWINRITTPSFMDKFIKEHGLS